MRIIRTVEEKVLSIFALIILMLSMEAFASIIEITVPQQADFSSNKEVVIDIDILVSNLCVHNITHSIKNSTRSQIYINIDASEVSESFVCAQAITKINQKLSLGLLAKGTYDIDINDGQTFIALDVL